MSVVGEGEGEVREMYFLFLIQEFVEVDRWAHLDIAGVMESHGEEAYLNKGMSGGLLPLIRTP